MNSDDMIYVQNRFVTFAPGVSMNLFASRLCFVLLLLPFSLVACGPLPGFGYSDDSTRYQRTERQESSLVKVQTGRRGSYYIVDRERHLCFFRSKGAMAAVDCSQIPEAAELLGVHEEGTQQHEAPAESEPAPASDDQSEQADTDLGERPSADEKRRFTMAYISLYCAQDAGHDDALEQHVTQQGLTLDRYSQIEGWLASDAKGWRTLTSAARNACRSVDDANDGSF